MPISRIDANQKEIVAAARKLGASVKILNEVRDGCPDLLIGYRKINYLCEIKDGTKPASKRRLTPAQDVFHELWRGQICILYSIDDLLNLLRTDQG